MATDKKIEYQSGATVAQRPPIYIDVNKDPRAKSQAYLNLYASRVGAEVIAVDLINGNIISRANPSASNGISGSGDPSTYLGYADVVSSLLVADSDAIPTAITNLVAIWQNDDVKLTFTFDTSADSNKYLDYFLVQIHDPASNTWVPLHSYDTSFLSLSSSSQTLTIKDAELQLSGLSNVTTIDKVKIAPFDVLGKNPGYTEATLSGYTNGLPAPTLSISAGINSYSLTTNNYSTASAFSNFYGEVIEEYITTETVSSNIPSNAVWQQVLPAQFTNTAAIYTGDTKHRWVRATYYSKNGGKSPYSTYVDITPTAFIQSNITPPTNVTAASAVFSSSGLGDDVVISFTLPTDGNAGSVLRVKLVPTAATSLSAYFNYVIQSGSTSITISSQQLYGQFSEYYSSFTADVSSLSNAGIESQSALHISTFSRTNSISSITPSITVTPAPDGYVTTFSMVNTTATRGELYEFYIDPTSWLDINGIQDYYDGHFVSGGAQNTNSIVLNNFTGDAGQPIDPTGYIGYLVTGTNLPSDTWVTNVSGTGPEYTVLLNHTFTGQASGDYHFQSLVYSGPSPANIFSSSYIKRYVVGVLYDKYGNHSIPSIAKDVTPINPGDITSIINAINVGGTEGAIYVGTSPSSTGSRVAIVGSDNLNNSSGYAGIFAYNDNNDITTRILANSDNGYTFKTTNAHIGDWNITETAIENTISTPVEHTYTGISGSGTYAFWAGADASGNSDGVAKFYVKPTGQVHAENIYISGNGTTNDLINAGGGTFRVTNQGAVEATSATITGSLNVSESSNFNSNINIGTSGIITAGASQSSGASVQINYQGLVAYDTNHSPTTRIYGTAITGGYTFQTSKAILGANTSTGWIVGDSTISSDYISLDSGNQKIQISASNNPNYGVRMLAGATSANAIEAGSFSNPNFKVSHLGILTANGASINGNITVTGEGSYIKSGKESASDYTNKGYYFGNNGTFLMGGTSTYIRWNDENKIELVTPFVRGSENPYNRASAIRLETTGTLIQGLPILGDADIVYRTGGYNPSTGTNNSRLGLAGQSLYPLGPYGRQRTLIEDPEDGIAKLGFGIYYSRTTDGLGSGTPSDTSGYIGDIWIVY